MCTIHINGFIKLTSLSGGSNYTLNVVYSGAGETLVGAVTPSSTSVQECDPSGFYSIDTSNGLFPSSPFLPSFPPPYPNSQTGNVTCVHGPIAYSVAPLADLDPSTQYYYQLFHDDHDTYYLYTFDTLTNQVVSSSECSICAQLEVLSVLP
jgi:hypothetical protein